MEIHSRVSEILIVYEFLKIFHLHSKCMFYLAWMENADDKRAEYHCCCAVGVMHREGRQHKAGSIKSVQRCVFLTLYTSLYKGDRWTKEMQEARSGWEEKFLLLQGFLTELLNFFKKKKKRGFIDIYKA